MKSKNFVFLCIFVSLVFILLISGSTSFAGEYTHTYKFEIPTIKSISKDKQIVELKGTRQDDAKIGAPLLPVRTAKIFIPADEKVSSIGIVKGTARTIDGTYTIQHATRPYPISGKGEITPTEPDPGIYSTDTFYPATISVDKGSQYLRGVQVAIIDLMPVIYNPVQGRLKYYGQIEVRVTTNQGERPAGVVPFRNSPLDRKAILHSIDNKGDFLELYPPPGRKSLSKEQASGSQSPSQGNREYVVITTSSLISAFTTLTDHRASAAGGSFTTHIENIANILAVYPGIDSAEKVRNFIIDMRNSHGTEYVVLGGDCDGLPASQAIPIRGCYAVVGPHTDSYIPADLYFGCLDGTWNNDGDSLWGESNDGIGGGDIDWSSEVYVGRIPADSATEATTQINKIIAYETGNPPWKTLLVGEKLDSAPTWGGDRMDWVYSYMNSMPKTELYDRDHSSNNWPKSNLLAYINLDNYNWLNHLGHGNPNWNMKLANADIASMTNNKHFFHYTQACYSGSIDGRTSSGSYISGDCIVEDMVNSNTHGAFAVIGNSRYGWYNSGGFVQGASNLAHKEFIEEIFTDGYTRLGEANQRSKTDLDLTQGVYRWIAFETNLLGCPVTEMEMGGGDECVLINDGSFENGPPPASAWTEWADNSCEWITDPSGPWGISAYQGTYAYWACGYCGPPSSDYVQQTISVPSDAAQLKFMANYYRVDSDDPSAPDYLYVKINGTTVFTKELKQANNTYPSWTEETVNISSYAGQGITLRFEGSGAGSLTGNVLVDYIRTCAGAGPGGGGCIVPILQLLLLD